MTNQIDTSVGPNPNLKWYMITARSQYENKAKISILASIKKAEKEAVFGQVIVPEVEQTVVVKGVKKTKKHSLYPGYLLVQMVASDETAILVKNSTFVLGFVGDIKNLVPLKDSEIEKILGQMQNKSNFVPASQSFKPGDQVRVIEGPFNNFPGVVEEIKKDKMKVVVNVSIFGRQTPVELDFIQVTKA